MDEMAKKWGREMFIIHATIPTCILLGEIFVGSVKVPLYLVCLNLNHEKTK